MVDKTGAALTFFLTLTKNRRSSLLFLAHLVLDLHGRKKNKIRTPYIYSLLKKNYLVYCVRVIFLAFIYHQF